GLVLRHLSGRGAGHDGRESGREERGCRETTRMNIHRAFPPPRGSLVTCCLGADERSRTCRKAVPDGRPSGKATRMISVHLKYQALESRSEGRQCSTRLSAARRPKRVKVGEISPGQEKGPLPPPGGRGPADRAP